MKHESIAVHTVENIRLDDINCFVVHKMHDLFDGSDKPKPTI